jgi:glycosyltransferase involved in cell wall biosynthesis
VAWKIQASANIMGEAARRTALSVVVPCFNEEESIDELLRRLTGVCHGEVGDEYEIVLVNDGSRDRTWPMMSARAAKDPHVVAVNLSRNHGHQLALTAGLQICRGKRVLIIDADLQDPPELLTEMMRIMDQGIDVVYGRRRRREGETWFKKATATAFYRVFRSMVDVDVPLDTGDFRLISRRALEVINRMPENHRFIRGIVSWIGFPQHALQYDRAPRFAGDTKYPLSKMLRFAFDAITGFSIKPLRFVFYLGALAGVIGGVVMLYVLWRWAAGETTPGWTSLAVAVLMIGSVQLIGLGIIGEYLGRMYIESKRRPLFIVQDIVAAPSPASPAEEHEVSECPRR